MRTPADWNGDTVFGKQRVLEGQVAKLQTAAFAGACAVNMQGHTQVGTLLGGAVLAETIFAWPGMGRLLIQAISQRDYPLVQGIVMVTALAVSIINVIVDLLYATINPRVRYG